MNTTFQRTITNELHSLESLMNATTNFLEDQEVDAQSVYRINLALEEMITNIIKHGYDDYESHEIHVTIQVLDYEIVGIIEDDGHEFDPLGESEKNQSIALQERPIGGMGIHLIKKLLTMTYQREAKKNILEIRTQRAGASS